MIFFSWVGIGADFWVGTGVNKLIITINILSEVETRININPFPS